MAAIPGCTGARSQGYVAELVTAGVELHVLPKNLRLRFQHETGSQRRQRNWVAALERGKQAGAGPRVQSFNR